MAQDDNAAFGQTPADLVTAADYEPPEPDPDELEQEKFILRELRALRLEGEGE